jgi:hypothetical protein
LSQPAENQPALAVSAGVVPISTAFAYQGSLNQQGEPAEGLYDFTFELYDALSGGAQVGATEHRTGVSVAGGVFDTQIDFGYDAFAGGTRWLEVAVSPAGANAFEVLGPRSPITAAPLALSLPNVFANPATGFVGIGTHSRITTPTLFQIQSPSTDSWGGMYVATSGSFGRPFYGYSLSGIGDAWHEFNGESREWRLYIGSVPRMRISEQETRFSGDVKQSLQNGGLVKAALVANCRKTDPYIRRMFDNISNDPTYMSDGFDSGECSIFFGFDISERFWMVDAVSGTGSYALTCGQGSETNQLDCHRTNMAGLGVDGDIVVTVY